MKNADGSYSYSRGTKIPVTIVPVPKSDVADSNRNSAKLRNLLHNGGSLFNGQSAAGTLTIFKNDIAPFIAGDTVDSALDDLNFATGGQGKAWKIVTFGINFADPIRTGKFLVRWIGYSTQTTGLGAGVSEFSGLLFDFGFYLDKSLFVGADTWQVTVDLTLNPLAIVPGTLCYFAQQFRDPQTPELGQGPFTDVNNVFDDNNGPTIGASQDVFWFDNPPDGIYDETEPDNFGVDHPNAGTIMLNIQVGTGNTTTLNPANFQWIRGVPMDGTLSSLWFQDTSYAIARAGLTLFSGEAPAQLVTQTFAPTTAITSLRIDVVSHDNTPNLNMRIDLFDFATGSYVNVYSGAGSTSDQTVTAFAPTPADFVDPATNTIQSKISWKTAGLILTWPWNVSVNMVRYTVTDS
ncbi:MAG TPA: hypothetical protein VNI20_12305 [Fimbriimonadaceae bacterium]|nr:hypothetical protein [Fimbriimonadaceae bacterium]